MPTEKQKAASKRWNQTNTAVLEGRKAWKAAQPKDSWWVSAAQPDSPRDAFNAHLKRRQAERLASGSDFARSPTRAI
jgi:hypothetical protein